MLTSGESRQVTQCTYCWDMSTFLMVRKIITEVISQTNFHITLFCTGFDKYCESYSHVTSHNIWSAMSRCRWPELLSYYMHPAAVCCSHWALLHTWLFHVVFLHLLISWYDVLCCAVLCVLWCDTQLCAVLCCAVLGCHVISPSLSPIVWCAMLWCRRQLYLL
jgi:hypothetical protein